MRLLEHLQLLSKTFKMPKTVRSLPSKFKCSRCLKECTRKDSLQKHVNSVHLGVKFDCPECDYRATNNSHLKRHIDAIHRNIRAFQCIHCDKSFTGSGPLKSHVDSIHNKTRFSCTVEGCHKLFTHRSRLKTHMKDLSGGGSNS